MTWWSQYDKTLNWSNTSYVVIHLVWPPLNRTHLHLMCSFLQTKHIVTNWWCVVGTQLGTPRGRYDEHSSKFPSVWNQGLIKPVGERTNFQRLMPAGRAMAPDNLYMAPYLGHSFAPAATWNLHTIQPKYFAPTSSEVVNLTGLL
jgi:hypothetical protein